MRRAAFICRPCLALIRRQHGAPGPGTGASLAGLATTSRRRSDRASFRNDDIPSLDGERAAIPSATNHAAASPGAADQPPLSDDEVDEILKALHKSPVHPATVPRHPAMLQKKITSKSSAVRRKRKSMGEEKEEPVVSAKIRQRRLWKYWKNRFESSLARIRTARLQVKSLDNWAPLQGIPRQLVNPPTRQLEGLLQHDYINAMRRWWFAQTPRDKRLETWYKVMAAALRYAPTRAHEVLEATYEHEVSPRHIVGDVLYFLVEEVYPGLSSEKQETYRRQIGRLVLCLLRNTPKGYLDVPQQAIYTVAASNDPSLLSELYDVLREYGHKITGFTKLHLVSAFARVARTKSQALNVLKDLIREDAVPELDSAPVAAAATSIIACAEEDILDPSLATTAYNVIARLSELGLTLNMYTCTAILRVFCLGGEMDKAWKVYDHIVSQGNVVDNFVLSTILHGAKLHGDFDSVTRALRELSKHGHAPDIVLCNDILHAIHTIFVRENERRRPDKAGLPTFPVVLQAYAKLFKLGPLQSLFTHNLAEAVQTTPTLPPSLYTDRLQDTIQSLFSAIDAIAPAKPLDPREDTLSIALSIYVRSLSNPLQIVTFYAHFRNLIDSGNKAALSIVNQQRSRAGIRVNLGTLIHDTVIRRLNAFPGMLRAACDVMRDMLRVNGDGQPPNRHPVPSSYTYNHLLHSLMTGAQFSEAEAILDMMRNHGIVPNAVTWNIMIRGYARSQDAWMAAHTLRRMEKAGFAADESTAGAFSMLRDRTAALEMLNQSAPSTEDDVQRHLTESESVGRDHTEESLGAEDAFEIKSASRKPRKPTEKHPVAKYPAAESQQARDAFAAMEKELAEKAQSEIVAVPNTVKDPRTLELAKQLLQKQKELAEKERELALKEKVLKAKSKELSTKQAMGEGRKVRRYHTG